VVEFTDQNYNFFALPCCLGDLRAVSVPSLSPKRIVGIQPARLQVRSESGIHKNKGKLKFSVRMIRKSGLYLLSFFSHVDVSQDYNVISCVLSSPKSQGDL
jgi:hypothetical protein